jgi:hypothetical protein
MQRIARRRVRIRRALDTDIRGLVEIEIKAYSRNYQELDITEDALADRFRERLRRLNGWVLVAEAEDGRLVGSMAAMPTRQKIADFVSWEQITDGGLCKAADFTAAAENVYVVNLDIRSTWAASDAQYKLMASMGEKILAGGYRTIFFESRMPGFRTWVEKQCGNAAWATYGSEKRLVLADEYSRKKHRNGFPHDPLLRFYMKNGFQFHRIVENAYTDPESLNFGIVCYRINRFRTRSRFANAVISSAFKGLMRWPALMARL